MRLEDIGFVSFFLCLLGLGVAIKGFGGLTIEMKT
jgi:hypothetical protein